MQSSTQLPLDQRQHISGDSHHLSNYSQSASHYNSVKVEDDHYHVSVRVHICDARFFLLILTPSRGLRVSTLQYNIPIPMPTAPMPTAKVTPICLGTVTRRSAPTYIGNTFNTQETLSIEYSDTLLQSFSSKIV